LRKRIRYFDMEKIEQDKEPLSDYEIKVKSRLSHDPRESLYAGLDLEEALKSLTRKQRKCFELVIMEGYTEVEVAGRLGISHQAVSNLIAKAKGKLKKILKGGCKTP